MTNTDFLKSVDYQNLSNCRGNSVDRLLTALGPSLMENVLCFNSGKGKGFMEVSREVLACF